MNTWVWDPHVGGNRIPPAVRERTESRVRAYAESRYGGTFMRLAIRFRGTLCYIDAYTEPEPPSRSLLRALGETREEYLARIGSYPLHLCRLRYPGDENAWSLAFYTYSNERYEPCTFGDGKFHGTPERAFDIGATYLRGRTAQKRRGRRTSGCRLTKLWAAPVLQAEVPPCAPAGQTDGGTASQLIRGVRRTIAGASVTA